MTDGRSFIVVHVFSQGKLKRRFYIYLSEYFR